MLYVNFDKRLFDVIFFRLNAYEVLPTSHGEGVIEIVLNSTTIANIQKKYGTFRVTSGFNKESLLRWLKEHNTDNERYASWRKFSALKTSQDLKF